MSNIRRGRGKAPRRPAAEVPTGLLDAYTESVTTNTMSDSDKFREGYVKKKDKVKKRTNKKSETESEEMKEEDGEEVADAWDAEEGDVVDSWDQIEVGDQPVPQKVKQANRKEEKKRKKEEQKKASGLPDEASPEKADSDTVTEHQISGDKVDSVAEKMEALTVTDPSAPSGGKTLSKEFTEEEKAAIKAEREAKKAAKANKKSGKDPKSDPSVQPDPVAAKGEETDGGKTKEQLKAERKAAFELQQKMKAEAGEEASGEKSKADLKAERRAKQESQRAAKEAAQKKAQDPKQTKDAKVRVPDEIKADDKKTEKKLNKVLKDQNIPQRTKVQRQVGLFSHLHQYERELSVTKNLPVVGSNIHPAIIQLGLQHAEGEIVGSSGRSISLLLALKSLLLDSLQQLAASSDLSKEVDNLLKPNLIFLKQCRQLSISMGNSIRYLKREIRQIEKDISIEDLKSHLEEIIDDFINVNFTLHPKAISETANKKIRNGDVILTYSYSKLVEKVLLDAWESGKKIKVIVADGRVQSLGRDLADNLVKAGIHTTYLLLTAASQVLAGVTKVLLGCDGVMANGCVLATVGTSQIALLAKSYNKPVTFCSETYKFTERVQTDSFVFNELLDPDNLVQTGAESQSGLSDWRDLAGLCLLNLVYDLTPASLVDSVVTEVSEIPPTSVPVILRLHNRDHAGLELEAET